MSELMQNPRFANYARCMGKSEDELRAEAPNSYMFLYGYIQWNRARIIEFSHVRPSAFIGGNLWEHEAYDEWLDQWVPT